MSPADQLYTERWWKSRDGLQLFARDYAPASGSAKCPVICIHGLTRNSADFEDFAPWAASLGRRVIALDVRGRGRSDWDPDSSHYTPLVYAKDVAGFLKDMGIARAVFVGTSMGGIITMTLALTHSKLIAAAVLNDVGPSISSRGLERIAGYVGRTPTVKSWEDAAKLIKGINGVAFPANDDAEWLRWAKRSFAQNADGELALRYDPGIATAIKAGDIKTTSWIARFAFKRLARRRPVLLVHGALSDLIEAPQVDYMTSAAPTMEYARVENVGHAPMLSEPEAKEAITRFLARVD